MADRPTPINRWDVLPLRELAADVPLAFVVEAATPEQTAVSLGVGRTVTIDSEGLVRNASGTPIFRLRRTDA